MHKIKTNCSLKLSSWILGKGEDKGAENKTGRDGQKVEFWRRGLLKALHVVLWVKPAFEPES